MTAEIATESLQKMARHRLIILGASNVTLSFPLVLNTLLKTPDVAYEVFAAHGHGRSFCAWSYVLHRGLPSILESALWADLNSQLATEQTWGLITDVGNDLIYGQPVEVVYRNVEEAFARLQTVGARITYIRAPIERIFQLNETRYRIIKQLFFPGPTVPWTHMQDRVVELDRQLVKMAESKGATIITPRLEWYGLDPIHIRQIHRVRIWKEIFSTWPFPESALMTRPSYSNVLKTWNHPPAERTYWETKYRAPQPIFTVPDKLTLWQY